MAITFNFTGKAALSTESTILNQVTDMGNSIPWNDEGRIGILKNRVDLANIPAASYTRSSTDTFEAIHIPAFFKVIDAWFVVVSAETTGVTGTLDLNIGTATFVTAATCAVANVAHCSENSTMSQKGGFTTTADDTLDMTTAVAAMYDAVIDVYALVVDMRAKTNRD